MRLGREERRLQMSLPKEDFGRSVESPDPSEALGKETEDWELREGGQMQPLKPETKERHH